MNSVLKRFVFIILGGGLCFLLLQRSFISRTDNYGPVEKTGLISIGNNSGEKGYRDVILYNGRLLAVGTEGRIDHVNNSGVVTPLNTVVKNDLNCIISENNDIIIVGDGGTILISKDGINFEPVESGIKKNIHSVTCFNGMLIASADDGVLLVSGNGNLWSIIQLKLNGNIVSVTSNMTLCIAVTDRGEILRSQDGLNWSITDFNKEYEGYYKACIFTKAFLSDNRIVIAGRHYDGTPVVLFSTMGNVWTERTLVYNDIYGKPSLLKTVPNDIAYDEPGDQFFIACDQGEILSLPSCTQCNVLAKVSENDIFGILCSGHDIVSVGEAYSVEVLNIRY